MCGIIGICQASERVLKLGDALIKGLLRLEYRGYDSAGIGLIDERNRIVIVKKKGRISELEKIYSISDYDGVTGIAHTRWATHGPPSDINAHPHVDCDGLFIVVHNGIIENYVELRNMLRKRGHVFKSDTDTEVVAHLVEEHYGSHGDLYLAFKKAIKELEGTYAILLISPLTPERIYFAKKDSPLIIGLGESFNLLASDIPALLEYTRKVIVLRDYWAGYVSPREVFIEDVKSDLKVDYSKYIQIVQWRTEDASKEGYSHFMLKEIFEQPRALQQTISGLRSDQLIRQVIDIVLGADRVFITGSGTSFHASEYFAFTSMKLAGISVIPFIASEYELFSRVARDGDVLIAVSQSGETIDVLKATRAFKDKGVRIVSLTNVIDSAISRESDLALYMRAGPEIGVAATKTFLTQVLSLSWITLGLSFENRSIDRDEYSALIAELEKSGFIVEKVLCETRRVVEDLAERLAHVKSMYYLSRDIGIPVAREGALKIKEIAYVHAEAYPAGESKHGPIALVEPGFYVFFIIPNDNSVETKLRGNIEEMKARGAVTIGVLHEFSQLQEILDYSIKVPLSHWFTTAITHTPPLQLLAYYLAVKNGYDPDKPRNLAKTVTVE
ncbi:MAG: glutamine--fructose-6-phosphate transaminase (isomerizing) [Desulfurococcaceae archaeon]